MAQGTPGGAALLTEAVDAARRRDPDTAAARLTALVQEAPRLGSAWASVARFATTLGEAELAIAAARLAAQASGHDRPARLALAETLARFGRTDEAVGVLEPLAGFADVAVQHLLGTLHAQAGRPDAARENLRRALRASSDRSAASWLTLASLKRFEADDPEFQRLRVATAQPGGDARTRGTMHYALGKALDDLDDTDAAFTAISEGARLIRTEAPYEGERDRAFVEAMLEPVADGPGLDSDRPIFVLGMPRSGTTLVEQILASHSGVSAGAELNLFRRALTPLPALDAAGVAAWRAGGGAWSTVGATYLRLLASWFGPDGRVVDKTLNHSRLFQLISRALRNARFVWLRRDPADTAWSCFRTCFAQGMEWSWSLEDIAAYHRLEDRLHAHWTAARPDAVLTVPYEELTAAPETWIPRLLAHCGLAEEPGVHRFHETSRPVLTASVEQVRQPMTRDAVGGWRRYERQLQPFLDAYQT